MELEWNSSVHDHEREEIHIVEALARDIILSFAIFIYLCQIDAPVLMFTYMKSSA